MPLLRISFSIFLIPFRQPHVRNFLTISDRCHFPIGSDIQYRQKNDPGYRSHISPEFVLFHSVRSERAFAKHGDEPVDGNSSNLICLDMNFSLENDHELWVI
jgi:hypothetical protein